MARVGITGVGIKAAAVRVRADARTLGVRHPFRLPHSLSPALSSKDSLYRAQM